MSEDVDISTADTAKALEDGTARVIDVREPHEREAGHIAGTEHVPVNEIGTIAGDVADGEQVIFYCLSGGRSTFAAEAFRKAGVDARSMAGGMTQWDAEDRPIAPEGGYVLGH
jgi:rhodanese-related sulfurtransferase